MYEPSSARLRIVKSRISEAAWAARVKAARRDEQKLLAILASIEQGASKNEAIRRCLPKSKRSWAMHYLEQYQQEGLEALIDARTPREPQVSGECKLVLETAREANPALTERVMFYENPRDPEMTAALQEASRRLNMRKLFREDRPVAYCCSEAP